MPHNTLHILGRCTVPSMLYSKVPSSSHYILQILFKNLKPCLFHWCMRTGPMEKARFEVFLENFENIIRAKGNPKVEHS
ncbi:hypothetical protein H5410_016357 [Solanum commersonii]|uniref:Uncharacterized protein n=1 Tax=Solanum commersonii TaxID=4109 RepID=A0A9J5ZW22_SOLCO|nr:hypothetical protein H5410_016357 [Solanum commersonii]